MVPARHGEGKAVNGQQAERSGVGGAEGAMLEVQFLRSGLRGMMAGMACMARIVGDDGIVAGATDAYVGRKGRPVACGGQDAGDGRRKRRKQDRETGDPRGDMSDPYAS
jgi:hypothetical protein